MIAKMLRVVLGTVAVLFTAISAHANDIQVGSHFVYHSTVLNEDREYQVALPASYNWSSPRRYPVLYVLDAESEFLHTAADAEFLAKQGEIPELLIVGIKSTVRVRDYTQTDWATAWVGGGGAKNFQRFLSSEFIPLVDRSYRTDGFRILSGHSSSGQFALYSLTTDPHLFQAILISSPSLNWDGRIPIRSLDEAIPTRAQVRNFVYFASSDDSGDALSDDEALATVLKNATGKGIRSVYRPFPEESHGGVALLAQIDGLRQLFAGYQVPRTVSDRGLQAVQDYYARLSEEREWKMGVPASVLNTLAYNALQAKREDEAFILFRRNISDSPNSPDAYDGLADAYQQIGELKAALETELKAKALAEKFDRSNLAYYNEQIARIRRKQLGARK
jgi:predicted alpha/beta superfamily hydrolase